MQKAMAYLEVGRPQAALDVATAGLANSPDDVQLLFAATQAYRGLGEPLQALMFAKRMIALQPESATYEALARVYLGLNNHREALAAVEQALEFSPDSASAHSLLAQVVLGDGSAFTAATRARAIGAAMRSVELAPDAPEFYWTASHVHLRLGELDKASEMARKGLAIDPQHIDLRLLLDRSQDNESGWRSPSSLLNERSDSIGNGHSDGIDNDTDVGNSSGINNGNSIGSGTGYGYSKVIDNGNGKGIELHDRVWLRLMRILAVIFVVVGIIVIARWPVSLDEPSPSKSTTVPFCELPTREPSDYASTLEEWSSEGSEQLRKAIDSFNGLNSLSGTPTPSATASPAPPAIPLPTSESGPQ